MVSILYRSQKSINIRMCKTKLLPCELQDKGALMRTVSSCRTTHYSKQMPLGSPFQVQLGTPSGKQDQGSVPQVYTCISLPFPKHKHFTEACLGEHTKAGPVLRGWVGGARGHPGLLLTFARRFLITSFTGSIAGKEHKHSTF